jgi:hypothetical protein
MIPASVTVIEEAAFDWCMSLSEVNFGLPSKLSVIEDRAFAFCRPLQSVHSVSSVSDIGSTFIRASGVKEMTVDEDNGHFRTDGHFLIGQEGPSVVTYFGCEAEIVIPSYVLILKTGRCCERGSLEAVAFEGGSRLQSIEREGFAWCESLRSIRLQASLEVIGALAFVSCSSLATVTFEAPSRVRVIDQEAFALCQSLASIRFPGSLKSTGQRSFGLCDNLRRVEFESGSLPPEIHPDAFQHCDNLDTGFLRKRACNVA